MRSKVTIFLTNNKILFYCCHLLRGSLICSVFDSTESISAFWHHHIGLVSSVWHLTKAIFMKDPTRSTL